MRTQINSGVRFGWIAALTLGVASAMPARAQEVLDEDPATTISDEPDQPAQPAMSPAEADRKARTLFQQGRQAYEDGKFRDSWDYFRQAYLLSKRPELLYNVGQSADRLRMDREALDAFRLYLERLPNAENRREVENRVRALEGRLGETPSLPADGAASPGAEGAEPNELDAPSTPDTPPAPPPNDGQPERTGWYARFAAGPGYLHDSVGNLAADVTISSLTLSGEIAVGYDIDQGIVIGGALIFDWSLGAGVNSTAIDIKTANLTLVMAFIDYYLQPRQDGWHLQGGLGFGAYALSDTSATIGSKDAGGIGIMGGGGYEWPIDPEWAIGVLGRIVLAGMNQDTGHHVLFVPSVAFAATWY